MTWFDEARLDDPGALALVDLRLRTLAESGARVRREAALAADAVEDAVGRARDLDRPRAVVAAGPDSRLLRAVLEPWCPVPFVAWPGPALPGWAGSLDLVVVLAPDGDDPATASAVAEAVRRGCQVVVACPPSSLVAEHATGRWTTLLPTSSADQLATAVLVLQFLCRIELGPHTEAESVAAAMDAVAISCSPHRDLDVNPAKMLAIALADTNPVLWGGSALAARAARRVAESIRRATGRAAVAGDVDQVLPVLEATRARTVFDDPFADGGGELRPTLLMLDDGSDDPVLRAHRKRLEETAAGRGVRTEWITTDETAGGRSEVGRYASLLLTGLYTAEYLRVGLVDD